MRKLTVEEVLSVTPKLWARAAGYDYAEAKVGRYAPMIVICKVDDAAKYAARILEKRLRAADKKYGRQNPVFPGESDPSSIKEAKKRAAVMSLLKKLPKVVKLLEEFPYVKVSPDRHWSGSVLVIKGKKAQIMGNKKHFYFLDRRGAWIGVSDDSAIRRFTAAELGKVLEFERERGEF